MTLTQELGCAPIQEFEEYDLIGFPRLVRLNPNIPWKTRGNGAICLRFGEGRGRRTLVCRIGRKEFWAFQRGCGDINPRDLEDRVAEVVETYSHIEDENTNPAFVILKRKPPPSLYWRAVRSVVELEEVKRLALERGSYRLYKNGRGLIGATSAISWRPRDRTFEIIAYRDRGKWGTRRELQKDSVKAMDRKFRSTFNNYDCEEDHIAIAPNSPCPVLFGIRGDNPGDLLPALSMIRGEKTQRWTIFLTNQGTDEHLVRRRIRNINRHESVILKGRVTKNPKFLEGGHVVFEISDGDRIDCTAYEPSKNFRKVASHLSKGDELTVYGSVREEPRTINLEKMLIHSLVSIEQKIENPKCPRCGKSMKSSGSNAGYRCRRCHTRAEEGKARKVPIQRPISVGLYEPPVSARRHLSKPLKRIQNGFTFSRFYQPS
ncbi:MAG: DUF1743 domain-containing protein [Thermoplasmata archaeon]